MFVVVCMRDSYSNPTAVGPHWLWPEAFMSRMKGFLCCYVNCVAVGWFESMPANHMDAQSKRLHCSSDANT